MTLQLFKELYDVTIEQIEIVRRISLEYDMINSQEWINFQDELNRLSLDPYQ